MFGWLKDKINTANTMREWQQAGDEYKKKMAAAPKPPAGSTLLSFKDAQSAVKYACDYTECSLKDGSILPALVLKSRVLENGLQICDLELAAAFVSTRQSAGLTAGAKGPKLEPGMLVAWQVRWGNADATIISGRIIATLHPNFDIEKGWIIDTPFEAKQYVPGSYNLAEFENELKISEENLLKM